MSVTTRGLSLALVVGLLGAAVPRPGDARTWQTRSVPRQTPYPPAPSPLALQGRGGVSVLPARSAPPGATGATVRGAGADDVIGPADGIPGIGTVTDLPGLLARPRIDATAIEPLYHRAILSHGTIDRLLAHLAELARRTSLPKRMRANALLVASHLQWRHGQLPAARQSIEQALEIEPYDATIYQKAVLLDAMGDVEQAKVWYRRAVDTSADVSLKERARLRLTFIDAIDTHVDGLVTLAQSRERAFRNRAAVALAILDRNDAALSLYQTTGSGAARFRQHVRLALWAIKAGQAARAQTEAWTAVEAATLDRDRLYALCLLTEAHALDDSLDRLLMRLDQKPQLTREEQALQIDLLGRSGRYQRAIDLFTRDQRGALTPELRQQLLRMYADAGQVEGMVAEYRRLLTQEPGEIAWPRGLAQHYLEQDDRAGAQSVWNDFLERTTSADLLVSGAEAMTALGLHDLAIASTEKAIARSADAAGVARGRLTQFELYLDRGLNGEAERALASADAVLPADSPSRPELAEAYERLGKPQLAVRVWEALARAKGNLSADETMRLAWLLDSTGRRDDALSLWKTLWTVETQSARRHLVEDRLLMLAAELGRLGDLAVELEDKLAKGTAEPRDSSLLIGIYTKVGDSASAIEVITESFSKRDASPASRIASLKEQARVYLTLDERPAFEHVTRRLLAIDPDNKAEHLQALLLNRIESGSSDDEHDHASDGGQGHAPAERHGREEPDDDDRLGGSHDDLREWLAELRKVGGAAVGGEFEAGVLDLAGRRDEAVDAYRRALARHPDRGDNHLLLADLLKQGGRRTEAVAALQYLTETADGDDLFLVGLDGIANMRTGDAATLKWAERRALERLTARDDKLYLYEMLSELAEEARDATLYASALENALAHADSRRSQILRELLASSGESSVYTVGQGLHRPDPKRNLMYARRLIALGEELPPDVYVNLGKTFLAMKDPGSAMRAFTMAVDRTGRTSVVAEAARLFDQGGYDREAIQQYERALIASSGDVQTMYRLGRVRDRVGLTAGANALYLRALLALSARQTRAVERGTERTPARQAPGQVAPPALDSVVTLEYRRYYSLLLHGLIATLPPSDTERRAIVATLEEAFDRERQQVLAGTADDASTVATGPAPLGSTLPGAARTTVSLASYPRLGILAQAATRVALAASVPGAADRINAALARPVDREPDPPVAATPPDPLQRALTRENFRVAVGIALARRDQPGALAAYRQWVRDGGLPKPPTRFGSLLVPDRSPAIPEIATHAWTRLDGAHFASLARFIDSLVSEQDAYAEKLLTSFRYSSVPAGPDDVPILTRIERTLGHPLFGEDRLMRLVGAIESWRDLDLSYVLARLSPTNQIDVIRRYTRSPDMSFERLFTSIGVVLSKPLDDAQAASLLDVLKVAFGVGLKRTNGSYALPNLMNYRFTGAVHAGNVPVIDAIERDLAGRYPQLFQVGYFKASLLRDLGRDREALASFVDAALRMYVPDGTPVNIGQPSPYAFKTFVRTFAELIFPKYAAEMRALLLEKEREGITDALIAVHLELSNNDPGSDHRARLATIEEMAGRHPDNELLLKRLYPMYEQWGHTAAAAAVMTRLVALRPDDKTYRHHAIELWQQLQYPEKALEVAGGFSIDALARAVPRNAFADVSRGGPTGRSPLVKRDVDRVRALAAGGDQDEAARALRGLLRLLPPPGLTLSEHRMQMTESGDAYLSLLELLALRWQVDGNGSTGTSNSGTGGKPAAVDAHARLLAALEQDGGRDDAAGRGSASGGAIDGSASDGRRDGANAASPGSSGSSGSGRVAAGQPRGLLEEALAYPFAADVLGAYLRTLDGEDLDKHHQLYELLADGYARQGRAAEEVQRRTTAVRAKQADAKTVTLWLALAARQAPAEAATLWQEAERAGIAARPAGEYQRVLLARLSARAGDADRAADLYIATASSVLADASGTDASIGYSLAADPYGRDSGATLFTAKGLYDDARAHLDRAGFERFAADLLMLVQTGSRELEPAFAQFAMSLQEQALQAGSVVESVREAAATLQAGESWNRADLLRAASVRARSGQADDATALLRRALRKDLDIPLDPSAAYRATQATRGYRIALGIGADLLPAGAPRAATGIEEFLPLFPARADGWQGVDAWVTRIARELPGWVDEHTVNRDAAVQLLSLLTLRLHQRGKPAAAHEAALDLNRLLREGAVSVRAATLAVSVADRAGVRDVDVLRTLIRENRLPVGRLADLVDRAAVADGPDSPAGAFELGELALRYTSDDDLLARLIRIAREAGDTARAAQWTGRQSRASAARAALDRKP